MPKPKTVAGRIARLSVEDQAVFTSAIRFAVFHLATCWDYLGEAERIIESDIETDDISGLAGEMDIPPDNAWKLTAEAINEWGKGTKCRAT